MMFVLAEFVPPGWKHRLHGRQDACRHEHGSGNQPGLGEGTTDSFHNFYDSLQIQCQLRTLSLFTPVVALTVLSIFPSGPADQTMTGPWN